MIEINVSKNLVGSEGSMQLKLQQAIESGKIITVYGASGAGKTSLLRILAGLLTPEEGKIKVDDELWLDTSRGINKSPGDRSIGMVFQDLGLFPNMTVRGNLEYALTKQGSKSVIDDLLEVMELKQLTKRKPSTLSGGQQQRVALARALVRKPKVLLMDEPLSALDADMRRKLQQYILEIHREFQPTLFLVSHDTGEIFRLSDQVMALEQGQLVQFAKPLELFSKRHLSGKFQFTGEVAQIVQEDVVFVVTVLIDKHLVKVIVDETIAADLSPGDKVLVASKAFNPIIVKL